MEWKIGEIFEYNGGWYQCIVGNSCENCAFNGRKCYTFTENNDPIGDCCADRRKDNKDVIFKKLEKVGEPYEFQKRIIQAYELYTTPFISANMDFVFTYLNGSSTINIIIKQNKEDMEEKKLNLKPFDIQKAREGKSVCTRDGHKARIICFDRRLFYKNVSYPILALVERSDGEDDVCGYNEKGKVLIEDGAEYKDDLMMLPEKKEGWVNVYKRENEYACENECNVSTGIAVYKSEGEAKQNIDKNEIYVNTIKITWEE